MNSPKTKLLLFIKDYCVGDVIRLLFILQKSVFILPYQQSSVRRNSREIQVNNCEHLP